MNGGRGSDVPALLCLSLTLRNCSNKISPRLSSILTATPLLTYIVNLLLVFDIIYVFLRTPTIFCGSTYPKCVKVLTQNSCKIFLNSSNYFTWHYSSCRRWLLSLASSRYSFIRTRLSCTRSLWTCQHRRPFWSSLLGSETWTSNYYYLFI